MLRLESIFYMSRTLWEARSAKFSSVSVHVGHLNLTQSCSRSCHLTLHVLFQLPLSIDDAAHVMPIPLTPLISSYTAHNRGDIKMRKCFVRRRRVGILFDADRPPLFFLRAQRGPPPLLLPPILRSADRPTDRDRKVNIFRLSLGPRCSFVRSSAPPPSASVCPLFAAPAAARRCCMHSIARSIGKTFAAAAAAAAT